MRPGPYYHRTYETKPDSDHNSHLGSGTSGRARSGSVGILDAYGNRTNRLHYHAEKGKTTLVREMPDAPPHNGEVGEFSYSHRPMLIPGAVTTGTENGTKRWDR